MAIHFPAIKTMVSALQGTAKTVIITPVPFVAPIYTIAETDVGTLSPHAQAENLVLSHAEKGVCALVARLVFSGGKRSRLVCDVGAPYKAIAEVVGKRLGLLVKSVTKVEGTEHPGVMRPLATMGIAPESVFTKEWLG
ncbi:hypothetical protein IAT38_007024 [Cryptococcus sp. DSM 104549]